MTTSWYLNQTVTQKKRRRVIGTTDSLGNDVYTESTASLANCLVEPRLSVGTEDTFQQEHVKAGMQLFCINPDADIQPTDRFYVDGVWWEVKGPIDRFRNSRMGNDYCRANLERETG